MKVLIILTSLICGSVCQQDQCVGAPDGNFPNLDNACRSFLLCSGGSTAAETPCPDGLVFDVNMGVCNWPYATCPPCGTGQFPSIGSCDTNTPAPDTTPGPGLTTQAPNGTTVQAVTTLPPTTTTTRAPITSYTVPWSTLPPQECGDDNEAMCIDNPFSTCETCHQYWYCHGRFGENLRKMACPPPFVIDYYANPERDCTLPEETCQPCGTMDCSSQNMPDARNDPVVQKQTQIHDFDINELSADEKH